MDKEIPAMLGLKRMLKGHSDRIYRLAWSPDGVILATPSRDCSVKLWNAETGELLHSINENSHVNCVAWSPDGSRLAIGGDNNLIQVWDVSNKCEILRMDGVFGNVWGLSWSPDGRLLASATSHSLKIWDIITKKLYYSLEKNGFGGTARCVAWSPDGNTLAIGNETSVVLLDRATNKAETLAIDNSIVRTISWFPNGKRIAWGVHAQSDINYSTFASKSANLVCKNH